MNGVKDNQMEMALINLLTKLVNYFDEFTYYKRSETIPFLLLSKNKYFKRILFGIGYDDKSEISIADIRKYEKGIFKKEVMETLKEIAKIIIHLNQYDMDDNNSGILSRFFNRH